MQLTKEQKDNELTIVISGELNTLTAPDLENMINESLDSAESLVVDFNDCDYVSSAGLRVLMATYKIMTGSGRKMLLSNVGENFQEVLENTGLDTVFDIKTR